MMNKEAIIDLAETILRAEAMHEKSWMPERIVMVDGERKVYRAAYAISRAEAIDFATHDDSLRGLLGTFTGEQADWARDTLERLGVE